MWLAYTHFSPFLRKTKERVALLRIIAFVHVASVSLYLINRLSFSPTQLCNGVIIVPVSTKSTDINEGKYDRGTRRDTFQLAPPSPFFLLSFEGRLLFPCLSPCARSSGQGILIPYCLSFSLSLNLKSSFYFFPASSTSLPSPIQSSL